MTLRSRFISIIVYDITNRNSFKKVISSIKELRTNSTVSSILIIGNKSDLHKERVVTTKEAIEFCNNEDVLFMETSAKNNINIKEILLTLVNKLPKPDEKNNTLPSVPIIDSYRIFGCCQ